MCTRGFAQVWQTHGVLGLSVLVDSRDSRGYQSLGNFPTLPSQCAFFLSPACCVFLPRPIDTSSTHSHTHTPKKSHKKSNLWCKIVTEFFHILKSLSLKYIYRYTCIWMYTNTEREQDCVCGLCVCMYRMFYLSLNEHLKVANIFCMALKVSVLVFYPLLSLTPMNNQQGIKLKSKQYLLHVLEEVNASFCKMWMCPVYELGTFKAYWFFSRGGLYPTPANVSGHLFTDFIRGLEQILNLFDFSMNLKKSWTINLHVWPALWWEVFYTHWVNLLFTEWLTFRATINVIFWFINTVWLLNGTKMYSAKCKSSLGFATKCFLQIKGHFLTRKKYFLKKGMYLCMHYKSF